MSLVKQYNLNDFFNQTFKLLGPITLRIFAPLLIILTPVSLLYGLGMISFLKDFFNLFPMLETEPEMTVLMELLVTYTKMLGMMIVMSIVSAAAIPVVISAMSEKFFPEREPHDIKTLLKSYYPRILLAGFLQVLITIGLVLVFAILIGIMVFLSTLLLKGLFIFIIVLLYLGLYGFMIWLLVSFSFSPFYIVMDDEKPWPSLKRSLHLLRKQWWRFLGISILFSLCLSFAMSLITSPLIMFGILPSISEFFLTMDSSMDEYEMLLTLFSFFQKDSFGILIGIIMLIQNFASYIFLTIYKSLFFIDLKVRKEELAVREEDSSQ